MKRWIVALFCSVVVIMVKFFLFYRSVSRLGISRLSSALGELCLERNVRSRRVV